MDRFKTLKNHVYDYIVEEIAQGRIIPGERINENEISDNLSVSRTPVREALIELSCFGVLENTPRKGFTVKTLSVRDCNELYFIIGLLEAEAAKLAIDSLDEKDYSNMQSLLEKMNVAIEQDNYNTYQKLQGEFHKVFINKCGNDVLIYTIENLKTRLIRRDFDTEEIPDFKELVLDTNREHEVIRRLLIEKDREGVADYIKNVHWRAQQSEYEAV